MKNFALMMIAVFGLSAVTFAQTEPKPKLDKNPQPLKTEKAITKKKGTPAAKKKETPATLKK